jgi:uncharacterized surface anchored protein
MNSEINSLASSLAAKSMNLLHPSKEFVAGETSIPVTGKYFGAQEIENAILAYGENLEIGADVIVFPKLISSFSNINGILDVAIRIGTAISPTLDNNITITARQKAVFDSSRITVVEL